MCNNFVRSCGKVSGRLGFAIALASPNSMCLCAWNWFTKCAENNAVIPKVTQKFSTAFCYFRSIHVASSARISPLDAANAHISRFRFISSRLVAFSHCLNCSVRLLVGTNAVSFCVNTLFELTRWEWIRRQSLWFPFDFCFFCQIQQFIAVVHVHTNFPLASRHLQ